jgi:hypothetical protein
LITIHQIQLRMTTSTDMMVMVLITRTISETILILRKLIYGTLLMCFHLTSHNSVKGILVIALVKIMRRIYTIEGL